MKTVTPTQCRRDHQLCQLCTPTPPRGNPRSTISAPDPSAVPAWVHTAACQGLERRKLTLPQAGCHTPVRGGQTKGRHGLNSMVCERAAAVRRNDVRPCYNRKRPRSRCNSLDRLSRTTLRHRWSRWTGVLVIVKPETVAEAPGPEERQLWQCRSKARTSPPCGHSTSSVFRALAQLHRAVDRLCRPVPRDDHQPACPSCDARTRTNLRAGVRGPGSGRAYGWQQLSGRHPQLADSKRPQGGGLPRG